MRKPKFQIKAGLNGQWYWHARNSRIVCDGAEGYATPYNCFRALERFLKSVGARIADFDVAQPK